MPTGNHNTSTMQNLLANQITPHKIEQEMKAKLTGVFNQSSIFFWYPPRDLVNERTILMKDEKIRENIFPGNG